MGRNKVSEPQGIMNDKPNSQTNRRPAVFGRSLTICVLGAAIVSPINAQEVLPFPTKRSGSIAERTMQESTYSPLPQVSHLPKYAPNILIFLIDDVGPAQTDTYGGKIHTPTLSRMAKEGISYNRFHTTAMCSPTRAALLTGRNHHRVASGQIAELANDWDGYTGTMPKSSATVEVANTVTRLRPGASGTTRRAGIHRRRPMSTGPPAMASNLLRVPRRRRSQWEPQLVRNT